MRMLRNLRRRARDAFRLASIWLALSIGSLNAHGLVGDGFEAAAAIIGTGPAILCFAGLMLCVIYGAVLTIGIGVVIACGIANLIRHRAVGPLPRRLR